MDDNDASNMKYDIGINYRINDNLEASLLYRKGGGNTIFTGTQKYKLDGFSQQFISLGLESDKMKFKVYQSSTDGGDTYNIGFLGAAMNEAFSGTQADGGWGQTYLTTYYLLFKDMSLVLLLVMLLLPTQRQDLLQTAQYQQLDLQLSIR